MEAKEMVPAVADDLILEILLRLPPVSVLKFKCVCKLWYSLISNPCFLRNHARQFHLLQRDRRLDPPGFLLSPIPFRLVQVVHPVYAILPQDQDELPFPPLLKVCLDHSLPSFHKKCSSPWICTFDSCNGLLLYHSISSKETKVFNPITNQYTEIPIMDLLLSFYKQEHIIKAVLNCILQFILFDPSISPSFKILTCLPSDIKTPDSDYEFHVYSSDTRSWRRITSFGKESIRPKKTFMFDGVFYWLKSDALICFDFVKESVWFLPLPPMPVGLHYREVLYFGECGGRLRLIEEYYEEYYVEYYGSRENQARWFPYSFDIMEKELGSTIWTVKTRVNIEAGYDHLIMGKYEPHDRAVVMVMHLYQTEKGEEVVLLNVDDRMLVTFNLTTNTFGKELTIPCFEHYQHLNAFSFTPTLFPLLT